MLTSGLTRRSFLATLPLALYNGQMRLFVHNDKVKAILFDMLGTLIDWKGSLNVPEHVLHAWPAYYVNHREPYVTLDEMNKQMLQEMGLSVALYKRWHTMRTFPGVRDMLIELQKKYIIGPLSNANMSMLVNLSRHNDLTWDVILSSELCRKHKPHPDVLKMASSFLGLPLEEILIISSHARFGPCSEVVQFDKMIP